MTLTIRIAPLVNIPFHVLQQRGGIIHKKYYALMAKLSQIHNISPSLRFCQNSVKFP